eukprot:4838339-Amphidinium_carterae.1
MTGFCATGVHTNDLCPSGSVCQSFVVPRTTLILTWDESRWGSATAMSACRYSSTLGYLLLAAANC